MLVVSIKVWQLDTREGIRVRITRIKKGGVLCDKKGYQSKD